MINLLLSSSNKCQKCNVELNVPYHTIPYVVYSVVPQLFTRGSPGLSLGSFGGYRMVWGGGGVN